MKILLVRTDSKSFAEVTAEQKQRPPVTTGRTTAALLLSAWTRTGFIGVLLTFWSEYAIIYIMLHSGGSSARFFRAFSENQNFSKEG